jgi:hypothetical protein
VAIGSNSITLTVEYVVSSLLSKEMRQKNMEGLTKDALVVRVRPINRGKTKLLGTKPKLRGRYKSFVQLTRRCWKCGKARHYKRDYNLKATEHSRGFDEKQSIERKNSLGEGGDVYLELTSKQSYHDVLLIESGAHFHMTPHREWFYEYENYEGGDVFLGDESETKIVGQDQVKPMLKDARRRTLPSVLHIPSSERKPIFVVGPEI